MENTILRDINVFILYIITNQKIEIIDKLTYARTTFIIKIAKTREAFLATGTGNEIAFATLREHTFTHDTSTDRFVAGFRIFNDCSQK